MSQTYEFTASFVALTTNERPADTTSTKSDDEESVKNNTSYQQLYDQVYDSNNDSDSDDYVAAISSDVANQFKPLIAKIQYGKIFANSTIDSGSVCSIIEKLWLLNSQKYTMCTMDHHKTG